MRRVVVDASALAAVVFSEAEGAAVSRMLENATLFAPEILKFELASTARKKSLQTPGDAVRILSALSVALESRWHVNWREISATDVVLLAHATRLSVYDASYLWLAGILGAELVTLDARLAAAHDSI